MTNQSGVWKEVPGLSKANARMRLDDHLVPWLCIPEVQGREAEGRMLWFISVHQEHGKNAAMLLVRQMSHPVAKSPAFVHIPVS